MNSKIEASYWQCDCKFRVSNLDMEMFKYTMKCPICGKNIYTPLDIRGNIIDKNNLQVWI